MNGHNEPSDSTPLPYTYSPIKLLQGEVKLISDIILRYPASFLGVIWPLWSCEKEDELCLRNPRNVISIFLHTILVITQCSFGVALIYGLIFPIPALAYILGVGLFLFLNYYFCKLLNGSGKPQFSEHLPHFPSRDRECWIFINGVAVGRDWFQSNLNVLSRIFRRRIIGVHNITYGILFDLIECLIQRDACYATADTRIGYAQVKDALLNDNHDKVVVLAHSQGGIEVGAIFDWLLDDLPADKLAKLEIYTFGSAANHFNNPSRNCHQDAKLGVVKHIEHYTNHGEFVSRFGILGFIRSPSKTESPPKIITDAAAAAAAAGATEKPISLSQDDNRFRGRLFKRNATGHMLNQHYLAYMFPREQVPSENGVEVDQVKDDGKNAFMDSEASAWDEGVDQENLGWWAPLTWLLPCEEEKKWESMVREDGVDLSGAGGVGGQKRKTPKELSRLWMYRDGNSPKDDHKEEEKEEKEGMHEREPHAHIHLQEVGRTRIGLVSGRNDQGSSANGMVMNGFAR